MTDLCGPQLPKFTEVLKNDINLAHNMNLHSIEFELDYETMRRYHEPQWIVTLVIRSSHLI
jgi:hypothetical protein